MPDGYNTYTNPDRSPATSKFKWVPKGPPPGNGTIGIDSWYKLILNRGSFRNDYFISNSDKTLAVVATLANGSSNTDTYFPINNSFRKLQTPNKNVNISEVPYYINSSDFNYEITLSKQSKLSSITLKYKCSVDINDANLLGFIEASDANDKDKDIEKIKNFRQNPTSTIMDVDWNKYSFLKIKVYKSNDDDNSAKQWPADGSEIKATGYYYPKFDSSQEIRNTNIKFSKTNNASDFVSVSKIKIINDSKISVKLTLNNIMLFDYGVVNFEAKNLPCSHMSYAIPIELSIPVSSILKNFYWPSVDTPSFSIKIFSPDQKIKSPGFAHSLSIKFLIAAFEDNFASFFNYPYAWIIFVGPVVGKISSVFYFDPAKIIGINGDLIRVNNITINDWADKFSIQYVNSESKPSDSSNWTYILNDVDKKTEDFSNNSIDKIYNFLYHNKNAQTHSWYRIEQKNNSTGLSELSLPFKAQIYTEKSVLELNTTGSSNSNTASIIRTSIPIANFDNQKPLAVFTLGNSEDFYGSNIQFKKGAFKFAFSGKSTDPNFLMSTHIFLRMWFHPGNEEVDYNNPERFRNSETEIIFKTYTNSSGQPASKIAIGKPTSLDELLVSAPLIDVSNYFEIVKYVDGLVDFNDSYIPYKNQSTVKIVIGIYEHSYLNNTQNPNLVDKFNPPAFELAIDSNSTYIEIPIIKNTTGSLSAQKYAYFNNVISTPLNLGTLELSNVTYSQAPLSTDGYLEYYKTFVKVDSASSAYSYQDLIALKNSAQPQKLVFKIPKFSLADDNSIYYFVDFVTSFNSLINTKVNIGSISLKFTFDLDFDNSLILNKIKIAAFFVNRYGTITERIFITEFTYLPISISKYEYNKTINITVPFYVSNYDCQIVFRLYYYPYSATGKDLTEEELAEINTKLKNKSQGLRLDDIQISFSAGLLSQYTEVSNAISSINYEDLPLIPTQSLDSQQFWFASYDQSSYKQYLTTDKEFKLDGAVYSPTWVVSLPSDIEVEIKVNAILQPASSANYRQIGYRTVPFDERITKDKKIAAVESKKNNSVVHLAKNSLQSDSIVSISSDTNNVNYYRLYNPLENPHIEGLVAGGNNALVGSDPNLCIMNNSDVSIMVNNADSFSSESKLAVNLANGYLNKWQTFNTNGTFEQQIILQASNGLNKVAYAFDPVSNNIYIVGYNQPSLIMKSVNPKTPGVLDRVNELGQNVYKIISYNYIIDGLQVSSYDLEQPLTVAPNLSELQVLDTFSGIAIDNQGNVMVTYVLEGLNNQIQARMVSSTTKSISNIIKVFDMGLYYGGSELNVFCPVIQYYNSKYYLLFWCAGKLFLTYFSNLPIRNNSFNYPMNPIYLVAGNTNLDDTNNAAHQFLKKIYANGLLIINNEDSEETQVDLEMQAAGMVVSQNQKFNGQIFVYYTLPSLDLVVKKITPGGKVSKATKIGD